VGGNEKHREGARQKPLVGYVKKKLKAPTPTRGDGEDWAGEGLPPEREGETGIGEQKKRRSNKG